MRVRNSAAVLGIFLATEPGRQLRVGSLVRDNAGVITFNVDPAYIALGAGRPIVSCAWKGATEENSLARLASKADKVMLGSLLPPFFENLLPEGALRELVEKELGAGDYDNFDVLTKLGGDLPGAIVAVLEAGEFPRHRAASGVQAASASDAVDVPTTKIRFSLAGIQLKFSVTQRSERLTVPTQDGTGEIILKTPSRRDAFVPEAEFTALTLAGAAGVDVAEAWLVDPDAVDGIPERFLTGSARSLAVRRFDRGPDGRRIHIEDFAQIMGGIGDDKYTMGNDETMINIAGRFSTDRNGQILEAMRRVLVNILLGNGDAHLKNWSLMHRNGETRLTPAYDVVPTFLFGDDTMALEFGNRKNPYIMGLSMVEGAARLTQINPRILLRDARRTVDLALDRWPDLLRDMPLPADMKNRLLERLPKLRLVQEVRPSFTVTADYRDAGGATGSPSRG
ncbi:hypothetical protein AO398_25160 [Methylobacterium sp. GXS13]|uniref:type II toxin-antitoxin system HipA family toxin n=1 Tax=Methylobacterium sp. GXS13 TaxID=1730094 RepID=UPI00071B9BF3|nr:type II toxin-antitoxin system HipA family toxin [Methylobacterium sp. GXS13]KST57332.1 hypothetical protein AO398_25160 [Methylobacterium sp. GXS13]